MLSRALRVGLVTSRYLPRATLPRCVVMVRRALAVYPSPSSDDDDGPSHKSYDSSDLSNSDSDGNPYTIFDFDDGDLDDLFERKNSNAHDLSPDELVQQGLQDQEEEELISWESMGGSESDAEFSKKTFARWKSSLEFLAEDDVQPEDDSGSDSAIDEDNAFILREDYYQKYKTESSKSAVTLLRDLESKVSAASDSENPEESDVPITRGYESLKVLLEREEALDELDREYKRILLGGVSKEEPEGVMLTASSATTEFISKDRFPHVAPPLPRSAIQDIDERGISIGVGRRKTSSCRVFLKAGTGIVTVNGKDHIDYFRTIEARMEALGPLVVAGAMRKYDVNAYVSGGGHTGQYGAFRVALAMALQKQDPTTRRVLVKNRMLTSDPRQVERKKYGKVKARKSFTFVKR